MGHDFQSRESARGPHLFLIFVGLLPRHHHFSAPASRPKPRADCTAARLERRQTGPPIVDSPSERPDAPGHAQPSASPDFGHFLCANPRAIKVLTPNHHHHHTSHTTTALSVLSRTPPLRSRVLWLLSPTCTTSRPSRRLSPAHTLATAPGPPTPPPAIGLGRPSSTSEYSLFHHATTKPPRRHGPLWLPEPLPGRANSPPPVLAEQHPPPGPHLFLHDAQPTPTRPVSREPIPNTQRRRLRVPRRSLRRTLPQRRRLQRLPISPAPRPRRHAHRMARSCHALPL